MRVLLAHRFLEDRRAFLFELQEGRKTQLAHGQTNEVALELDPVDIGYVQVSLGSRHFCFPLPDRAKRLLEAFLAHIVRILNGLRVNPGIVPIPTCLPFVPASSWIDLMPGSLVISLSCAW